MNKKKLKQLKKQKISNSRVKMRDIDEDNMRMSLKDEANGL